MGIAQMLKTTMHNIMFTASLYLLKSAYGGLHKHAGCLGDIYKIFDR